ncbi:sensor domain-containing diguanylate cyclase [Oceanidesulfovibrio marinus]|uniref:diguanylate cyclase n=1 Tax=Oceanidesulfovibrio marinus TaxID=370038 RepID=A0A6P1ZH40_9BACT|nr:sensor domain-containing diguanylate cyclase [Oceanidesulfovibrio marinus]TVM32856.1 hypothetical protein DQK91_14210 [Oceanidesulfovibrio marinus]
MFTFSTFSARLRAFMLLLGLLPIALGTIGFAFYSRDHIISDAHQELVHTAAFQKRLIDDWLTGQANNMQFLALDGMVRQRSRDGMHNLFMSFMATHPELDIILYVNPEGRVEVATSGELGVDVADREYFLAARQGKGFISDVLISRDTNMPIVIISSPLKDMQGNFGGAVCSILRMDAVNSLLAGLRPEKGGESYLIGKNNVLLSHLNGTRRADDLDVLDGEMLERIYSAASRGVPYKSINDGLSVVGATTLAKDGKWRIVVERPLDSVLAAAAGQSRLFGLACFGALLIVAPVGWLLARSMIKPLRDLAGYAHEVGKSGETRACPPVAEGSPKEVLELQRAFCTMVDQLEENAETLRQMAVTDPLTGLANRRRLEEEGIRLIDACLRADASCSALLVDIDHFKRVNDTYGHAVGDDALILIAETIGACCRISDLPARYGGEEFVIIASNTDARNAMVLAERIRKRVESTPLEVDGMALTLTVSVGVSEYTRTPSYGLSHLDDVLGKADSALYAAKEGGRNRVCLFEPAPQDGS